MKHSTKIILSLFLCFLLLFFIVGFYNKLEITNYTYQSSEIPSEFTGFKICAISDLHCKSFGPGNEKLINQITTMMPDIIVLTGDIVDEDHTNIKPVEDLLKGISALNVPIYYITGNHEFEEGAETNYGDLLSLFPKYNVTHLDDQTEEIVRGDSSITITGGQWYSKYITLYLDEASPSGFHILLYHGADFFDLLTDYNYDLILSGHIHGGIIRLPFINMGLMGNSGEFFPKYVSGVYHNDDKTSTMIVSRGLGDSVLPRFYNRPELVCVTLESMN